MRNGEATKTLRHEDSTPDLLSISLTMSDLFHRNKRLR